MLRRVRWPGWLVLLLLIIIIFTTIGKGSQAVINTNEKETPDKEDVKIVNEESSKYPGLNLKTQTKEANTYTSSISIPTTESEAINNTLHKWVKTQEDEFFTTMEINKDILGQDFRAHLNIHVETEKVTEDIYNLIFYSYQFAGGANGINIIKSFTIDLTNKKILALSDIMGLDEEELKIVQANIKDKLKSNEDFGIYIMDDSLDEVLNHPEQWEWSINKQAFTIYFNEYEIAAGAAGAIEVSIPLEEIKPYLKDNIVTSLEIVKDPVVEEKVEFHEKENVQLDPNGKYVALTFDDGPSSTVTPRVLETLKEYNAIATFFMLGNQVNYYPEIAKQVADDGHEIGNHTENHVDLTLADRSKVQQEIKDAAEKIYKASGQMPTTLRPPYGAYNKQVIDVAGENKQSIILWSVDSLDWQSRNANAVNQAIQKDIVPGSIVLMHDIHASTADALPGLLKDLKEKGYEFITVSQLLSLQEAEGTGPHYGTLNY